MTTIVERQRARLYTKKAKKKSKRFKKKARQFPLRFCIQKGIHFTLQDFSWNFWSWHWYTKSITLCVTLSVYIQKARHFAKTKTICDTFIYTTIRHFCFTRFSFNFWNFRRGGGYVFIKKQCTLRDIFILKKQYTLRYVAFPKEPDTMRYILITKKQNTFLYVNIHIIYCVALIPNYKRTYDQSDQIEK